MYREDEIKIAVKRLATAGAKVKTRQVKEVRVGRVYSVENCFNFPAVQYNVTLKNGSQIKFIWAPKDNKTTVHSCRIIC